MTSKDKRENPEQYQSDVEKLCDTYLNAWKLAAEGAHIISTDEKTGGFTERVEFEYIRHGTQCLMANVEVVTGRRVSPAIGLTRPGVELVAHIEDAIESEASGAWICVGDQLN
ncbi:MAG: hypothetical protein GY822_04230, partial [Deltaproteobacteria bacterium]|nr:hypothetical protein [Deltaproteobacteria bacterium]